MLVDEGQWRLQFLQPTDMIGEQAVVAIAMEQPLRLEQTSKLALDRAHITAAEA